MDKYIFCNHDCYEFECEHNIRAMNPVDYIGSLNVNTADLYMKEGCILQEEGDSDE